MRARLTWYLAGLFAVLALFVAHKAAISQTEPDTSWMAPSVCHFAYRRVVACPSPLRDSPRIAAELYQTFGGDSDRLGQANVREVIWPCRTIVTDPGRHWQIHARGPGKVATLARFEPVHQILLPEIGQWMFIHSNYLTGVCNRWPNSMAEHEALRARYGPPSDPPSPQSSAPTAQPR